MKKYIFIIISLCISSLCAWSVWEGNGIAGATTDFNEDGMFVKSSLFPKYTLIEIVNLENDIKVRAIVLEGKEIPGILMSFSPSVAEALKVKYGDVTRIRISSPSLTSDDIASSLYLPKEDVAEEKEEKDLLAMSEEKHEEPKKNEIPKINDEKEVVLYDFNPIAKKSEKVERKDGAVSFDPAFIEEDVKLDLHIPERPIVPAIEEKIPLSVNEKETPPTKKEILPLPIEAPIVVSRIVEKKSTEITPPRTVATPTRPIYLEDASLRPPKEVPSIVVVETKSKNEEPVKDVILIEKKKTEAPHIFIKVDEVEPIKEVEAEQTKKYVAPVGQVDETREKPIEKPETPEKVKEASKIEKPLVEQKKEEIQGVSEVEIPKHEEEEKDIILPNVIELPQVVYAPDEEKEVIEAVSVVSIPQKPEAKDEVEEKDVPTVDSVNVPVEDVKIEEVQKVEEVKQEEPQEKVKQEEEIKEEEKSEEETKEDLVDEVVENSNFDIKELDERPLSEIVVRNTTPVEEEPSKEAVVLPREKDIKALEKEESNQKLQEQMPIEESKIVEEPKPIEEVKPAEESKPIEETKPAEEPKPIEEVKPAEESKPIEELKSTEEPKPIEETRPAEELKPIEETKPAEELKPIEETKPAEELKPIVEREETQTPFRKEQKEETFKPKPAEEEKLKIEERENFSTGKILRGANYVQIAVYGSALAVEDVFRKYSGQYPMVIEKKVDNAGTRYVLFIGPLRKDEAGAIQERFRSFGFKDCFLK